MIRNLPLGLVVVSLLAPAWPAFAQVAQPVGVSCDQRDADAKREWAQEPHAWIANLFNKERRDISDAWCRIWETTSGRDRSFKAENFGRTLFTGSGIHPTVASSLAPGSGLTGGLRFSANRALVNHPVRLSGDLDARASTNGSWSAGARVNALGSGNRPVNAHNEATVMFEHRHLAELSYFGPTNDSLEVDRTAFGMDTTLVDGVFTLRSSYGLSTSIVVGGAWLDPDTLASESTASIASRFSETTTPGIDTATSYLVVGAGARWQYPFEPTIQGYRTALAASLRGFHETEGRPYSFRRLDLEWDQHYLPTPALGTFSAMAFGTLSSAGDDAVPFYLQPTLGGTGIDGLSALRSFADYRFRAPNRIGLTLEHEREIGSVFGSLLFVDVGQVADRRAAFRLDSFHHSFGAGVTIRAGNVTVLRFFYAFGGGEGSRTTFFGSTDAFNPPSSAFVRFD